MNRTLTDVQIRREVVVSKAGGQPVAHCETLLAVTSKAPEFIDITDDVQAVVGSSGARFGQATVFSGHTTAAIRVNENEPLLLQDLARVVQQLAPMDEEYEHNDFSRRENIDDDECANGHAHCQHLFLSTSETVPIIDGQLALGTWQRIFLVELDRPRERRVLVNIIGVRG
ncbi:MAG: secondary thiamine-phosphate synthase enzyme YjbQ [bacterium]